MAGRVRQPIDIGALEQWISKNVPQIEAPLDVKQVGRVHLAGTTASTPC